MAAKGEKVAGRHGETGGSGRREGAAGAIHGQGSATGKEATVDGNALLRDADGITGPRDDGLDQCRGVPRAGTEAEISAISPEGRGIWWKAEVS